MATGQQILTNLLAGERVTCGPLDGYLVLVDGRLYTQGRRDAERLFFRHLTRSDWAVWTVPASDWDWAEAQLRARGFVRHGAMTAGTYLLIAGGDVRLGTDGSADTSLYPLTLAELDATDWVEHTPIPPPPEP